MQGINSKGYLIDHNGNVIDKDSRVIFNQNQLENDEIPKIFTFTKFNEKNVKGEFEQDPMDEPILGKDKSNNFFDLNQKQVNSKGYIIDKEGNVLNKHGKLMFKKKLLDSEGLIPRVFRTGLLKRDGSSSFSRLMSEIDRIRPSEFDHEERKFYGEIDDIIYRARDFSENTSFDAMMEDTPANYNHINARKTPENKNAKP